jgi:DNA replication and repair protein RecF
MAHAELVATLTGRTPLLLLDEVAAHLDARRRAACSKSSKSSIARPS